MYLLLNHRMWWYISLPLIWKNLACNKLINNQFIIFLFFTKIKQKAGCNDYPFPFSFICVFFFGAHIYALYNIENLNHLIIIIILNL